MPRVNFLLPFVLNNDFLNILNINQSKRRKRMCFFLFVLKSAFKRDIAVAYEIVDFKIKFLFSKEKFSRAFTCEVTVKHLHVYGWQVIS